MDKSLINRNRERGSGWDKEIEREIKREWEIKWKIEREKEGERVRETVIYNWLNIRDYTMIGQ